MNELKEKLEAWLSRRLGGHAEIESFFSLSGGACQDNYLVDLSVIGPGPDSSHYELVLRMDKGGSLFGSLSRAEEFAVSSAAHSAGVKTPKPMWLETDTSVVGHTFYFMERIKGKADGRAIVKDKSLDIARKSLPQSLAASLAAIHSITPENCPDRGLVEILRRKSKMGKDTFDAVAQLRNEIERLPDAHPAMELTLNWLEKNIPVSDSVVLVHGDFRTGNFMVEPEGLTGIVDWEFAHWGDRHEDIAWLCMRDWRFGKLNKEAGGFADRRVFYDAYSAASGFKTDAKKVRFWEIMGNLRWAAGSAQQTERHMSGKDKGIELASIGRRSCEMEYEMMRLIENAVQT